MSRPTVLGSIVIPAYNEETVLARCLSPLAPAIASGMMETIVVCNGCTDATADVARSFAGVRVIELPEGSKPAALRAGDRAATALPRIYLDADVMLPIGSALFLLRRLGSGAGPGGSGAATDGSSAATDGSGAGPGAPLAARPPIRYDPSDSSPLVRRYFRARSRIPAVLGSLWGAGVYALSAAGRARFTEFPDLVADDLWLDQLFSPEEVEIIDCTPVTVRTPRHTRDLLTVLRRVYRGKTEYHAATANDAQETSRDTARGVGSLALRGPAGLVDAATYTGFAVGARLACRLRRNHGWERDDSSRIAA